MAGNSYKLKFVLSDGTTKEVTFTAPQGPQGVKGDTGATGAKGDKGDTGATGAKGDKGADGHTPVKGTDYWTSADKQEVIAEVLTAIGTPLAGAVDENNVITLGGDLADGTYTLRYYNQSGYAEIGTLVVGGSSSGGGENETPDAPDTTLTITDGVRIDTSAGAESSSLYYAVSNYIEVADGYSYTLTRTAGTGHMYFSCKMCYYDASKNYISASDIVIDQTTADDEVAATVPIISNAAYFRLRIYSDKGKTAVGVFTLSAEKA